VRAENLLPEVGSRYGRICATAPRRKERFMKLLCRCKGHAWDGLVCPRCGKRRLTLLPILTGVKR